MNPLRTLLVLLLVLVFFLLADRLPSASADVGSETLEERVTELETEVLRLTEELEILYLATCVNENMVRQLYQVEAVTMDYCKTEYRGYWDEYQELLSESDA